MIFLYYDERLPVVSSRFRGIEPAPAGRTGLSVSIVLWAGVVMSGRLIAYNWFQPR